MKKKLSNEELITFCGQMALILKSGISSLEGIYIMEDGDVQTEGREILKEIREELEMCGMLYPAMEKTGVFPEYALHMTEIGEQTGRWMRRWKHWRHITRGRRNIRCGQECSDLSGCDARDVVSDRCSIIYKSYASI